MRAVNHYDLMDTWSWPVKRSALHYVMSSRKFHMHLSQHRLMKWKLQPSAKGRTTSKRVNSSTGRVELPGVRPVSLEHLMPTCTIHALREHDYQHQAFEEEKSRTHSNGVDVASTNSVAKQSPHSACARTLACARVWSQQSGVDQRLTSQLTSSSDSQPNSLDTVCLVTHAGRGRGALY